MLKPVSVKTLVEFSAKSGSLGYRFNPSPSGQEGMEGHQRVVAKRDDHYQTEVTVRLQYQDLMIRGRLDGYDPVRHCIEEIKTFYGDFDKIPDSHRQLHWAQAKMYGWMFCRQQDHANITLALVYFHLHEQKEYRLEKTFCLAELEDECRQFVDRYYQWQLHINNRLKELSQWADQLQFPHGEMRPPQRQMAEAVYKTAKAGRVLLAEAPTGTGKTLAGIFPLLKAFAQTPLDKIFYLTAKNTGKPLALENIHLIATDSISNPLRVLELTAQDNACLAPTQQCIGESCNFALDFYEKLPDARRAAYGIAMLDQSALANLAHQYQICPFYLSMEMARWADLVIADYNYYFDNNALLFALGREFNWTSYILVDECHNLVDRARQMYTVTLEYGLLLDAKQQVPQALKKSLNRILRRWSELRKGKVFKPGVLTVMPSIPEKFVLSLSDFNIRYSEFLQHNPEYAPPLDNMQKLFFATISFLKIIELMDDDFCIDMQFDQLTLRNLVPARLLAERLSIAHGACFFSATLQPSYFYQALLGLPDNTCCIQVESPFDAGQLKVKLAGNLSTRYRDRHNAIEPLCGIVRQQLQEYPGNALLFVSSYDFLQQIQQQLLIVMAGMDIQLIAQSRAMNETERQHFIQQFSLHNNVLGLAVLGGVFGEGIDLPGDALKGVFIATLGLPQMNPVNEFMKGYLEGVFRQGYHFTYLYPGIQKVVQAAGRVIRTQRDEGYVWLLDERFRQLEIQQLMPGWWPERVVLEG